MMRHCGGCDLTKSDSEFWKNQSQCKECRREYDRLRYQTHYKEKRKETGDAWRKRQKERLRALKAKAPCTDCGEVYHPAAMQFDHLPGRTKSFEISSKVGHVSQKRLDEEIAKCELVCANCHAVRTETRRSSDNGSTHAW